jgi:spore maturation protein CgeB
VRVGVIGQLGPERFAEHVTDALRRIGHEAVQLGPARARYRSRAVTRVTALAWQAAPHLDERAQQRITQAALEAGCEVIINVDSHLMAAPVARLRSAGLPVAFWFPDHVANLGRQLMLLGPYNALFFKEPHLVERLRAVLDLPVYYLPEACNPRWHRPIVLAGTEPYLVVAGSMYPYRVRLVERLIAKGIPVKLYGAPLPRWVGDTPAQASHSGLCVFGDEKAKVFRSAAGVLSSMHPAEISGANGRLFQATGCGGAVLSEYRSAVPDLFNVGEEVLVYRDFDQLVDQATRLLTEPGLTARIGDAATLRAHRDHTYDLRVKAILERVLP